MVKRENKRSKRLSIDEKIQILLSHGNIADIKIVRDNQENTREEKIELGEIVSSLRREYKKGKLTKSQIKILEENGMVWKRQEAGRSMLDILIASGINIGDIKQGGKDLTEEERRLGQAKHNLKVAYRKGILSNEIIKEAENHGMVWNELETGRKMLDILIASGRNIGDIKQNGKNMTEEERRLGSAKHSLKMAYWKGLLSERIIKEAEEHGMIWRETKSRRKISSLGKLRKQKEDLEAKEEKARALLEEVQEQARKQEEQSRDSLDREDC